MSNKVRYTLKHIGINNPDDPSAQEMSDLLCGLFNLERTSESPTNIFVGSIFEVLKHSKWGVHGHIALQTEDVEAAMAELSQRGITFLEDTIRRDAQGKIRFIYLEQQIGGFAIHLTT